MLSHLLWHCINNTMALIKVKGGSIKYCVWVFVYGQAIVHILWYCIIYYIYCNKHFFVSLRFLLSHKSNVLVDTSCYIKTHFHLVVSLTFSSHVFYRNLVFFFPFMLIPPCCVFYVMSCLLLSPLAHSTLFSSCYIFYK